MTIAVILSEVKNLIKYNEITTNSTNTRNDKNLLLTYLPTNLLKRYAFTLAEVLITFGIIGVVAALTMPALIQNHLKKQVETRLKHTFSLISQAVRLSEAENGEMQYFGNMYGTEYESHLGFNFSKAFADTYIVPYLKFVNPPKTITLRDKGYEKGFLRKSGGTYWYNTRQVYTGDLLNGVSLFFHLDNSLGSDGVGKFTNFLIFVDVNGPKGPNVTGRDIFLFVVDNTKKMAVLPYGLQYTEEKLLEHCAPSADSGTQNLNCTALIAKKGWVIDDKYPW